MPIVYQRTGNSLQVHITQDITDLAANKTATDKDKIVAALQRCQQQLADFIMASSGTAALDAQILALQTQKAALPPPPPAF